MSTIEKTNNEKSLYLKFFAGFLAIVALLTVLSWGGDIDYTEQCILRMSYEEYDTIKANLTKQYGHEPSQRDIAHWWAEHHQ